MSAPKEIAELWPAVEQAAPNDPLPLLVCADRCAELCASDTGKQWDHIEFALRWCAGRNRRPYRTNLVRTPWTWMRLQSYYYGASGAELRRREPSVIPASIFNKSMGESWEQRFKFSYFAYAALSDWLALVRADLSAPTLTLMPPPEVVRTGPVACAACGLMRARGKVECPVCRSTEVCQ